MGIGRASHRRTQRERESLFQFSSLTATGSFADPIASTMHFVEPDLFFLLFSLHRTLDNSLDQLFPPIVHVFAVFFYQLSLLFVLPQRDSIYLYRFPHMQRPFLLPHLLVCFFFFFSFFVSPVLFKCTRVFLFSSLK